jgi:hypothetical protein
MQALLGPLVGGSSKCVTQQRVIGDQVLWSDLRSESQARHDKYNACAAVRADCAE